MKSEEKEDKSILLTIFIAFLIVGIFFLFYSWKKEDDDKTKKLLKQQNVEIQKQIQIFQDSIITIKNSIETITVAEQELSDAYSEINQNIQNIKPKYEKAASRATNFTADSIRWYFSNL